MTDSSLSPEAGPSVCPFVALAEDRDRRADMPDEGNRCYAERAPRRRDMAYQADYCYSGQFAACSVFLAWAARNAAEPAYVTEAAQKAWGSGITAPEEPAPAPSTERDPGAPSSPTPEEGLFGAPDRAEAKAAKAGEQIDWVSASAWAEAPWDERAEVEATELEDLTREEPEEEPQEEEEERAEEATQAPKVPAALPMRRRKPPQQPIRSRGSGEWFYADAPGREPLVSRRYGVTPSLMLVVLGMLLVAIVVFLLATQLGGGGGEPVAVASPTPAVRLAPIVTAAPIVTPEPTVEPSPTPEPKRRYYTVKPGDTLTKIAQKFKVKPAHLLCINGMSNKNIVMLGVRYQIPPEGFSCPPGWRKKATPEP